MKKGGFGTFAAMDPVRRRAAHEAVARAGEAVRAQPEASPSADVPRDPKALS
jgi:hypothetical protein